MKIVWGDSLKQAIEKCKPKRVAVAYLGSDYRKFLDPKELDEIIISPTFGTNPLAVKDIAQEMGWGKIHFLNELHAKIYIGDEYAVVGSANLTQNGLSGDNLKEVAVLVDDESQIKQLNDIFHGFRICAEDQYKSDSSKQEKILSLDVIWNKAISRGLVENISNKNYASYRKFENFYFLGDDFYVAWYNEKCDIDLDRDISDSVKYHIDYEEGFGDFICAAEKKKGDIRNLIGKFILLWGENSKDCRWIFIDEAYPDALNDEWAPYKTLLVEKSADKRKREGGVRPDEPFEIDRSFKKAFKEVMKDVEENRNSILYKSLVQNGDFRLKKTFKGLPLLVEALKRKLGHS